MSGTTEPLPGDPKKTQFGVCGRCGRWMSGKHRCSKAHDERIDREHRKASNAEFAEQNDDSDTT